jgi:arginyl-tRNA synthetase
MDPPSTVIASLHTTLYTAFKTAIERLYGPLALDPSLDIQRATRPEYGDYQYNGALKLAKHTGQKPMVLAQTFINWLMTDPIYADLFESLTPSGPGFINICFNRHILEHHLAQLAQDPHLGQYKTTHPCVTVVDYGGANVAKEMHVGHLRSAIIGDAIVRILGYLGHKVIRQNHLGDWGTQFGMIIEWLIETHWLPQSNVPYHALNQAYQTAKQRFDADPDFATRARARVVQLQRGDAETRHLWQALVTHSLQYFQKTYDQLGVLLSPDDVKGESFYNPLLKPLCQKLIEQHHAVESQGAYVIFLDHFFDPQGQPLPLMIQKKDGGYLYATTDLAAIEYRAHTLKASRIIYVVDARQKQHFDMVFAAAYKTQLVKPPLRLEHLAYGAILGDNRKPFKTRSGDTIKLDALLQEAQARALQMAVDKNPDATPEALQSIAQIIGIGALKYADLRNDKIKDYVFTWEKMLALDGNTAPYLQNAYVRIQSIFRKGNIDITALSYLKQEIQLQDPTERALSIELLCFQETLHAIGKTLHIHTLCDYLYTLAGCFHRFYEACPVLTSQDHTQRNTRLVLCDLTARTLKTGLNLLGIAILEKM